MGNKIDIGAYFDKLTRRGTGGRRSGAALRDLTKKGKDAAARTVERTVDRARTRRRGATRRGGSVAVEYSPSIDGDPDPGEVVWAWVPFEEDPTQGKDRPVVIIGRRGSKLVGVPLTSRADDREAQVDVGTGGWDPKRRTSYARIWRMLDVDPDGMRREGAVLDRRRFDQVVAEVDRYYDVTYPAKA